MTKFKATFNRQGE